MLPERPGSATLILRFDLVDAQTDERLDAAEERSVVEDARGTLVDLQGQLDLQLSERFDSEGVRVISLDIHQGSILLEIGLALGALAGALSLYGSARTGLDRLVRDVVSVCQLFLGRLHPYSPEVQGVSWRWGGPPAGPIEPISTVPQDQNFGRLLSYLIVSHAALVVGLIVVLLVEVT